MVQIEEQKKLLTRLTLRAKQRLAFFQEFFQGGAKFFCYANFSIVFGPNFRGNKSLQEGGKLPQGRRPLPPVEESQSGNNLLNTAE